MTPLDRAAKRARADVGAIDETASGRLVAAYADLYSTLRTTLAELTDEITQARKRGPVPPSWLYTQRRYLALVEQVERETLKFTATGLAIVTKAQREAIDAAREHAPKLTKAALGTASRTATAEVMASFGSLPVQAFERLVANTADGRPLYALFATLPQANAQLAAQTLQQGLALGRHPRVIAQDFRKATGTGLNRALVISRTETLRAYRQASLDTYRANPHIVTTWVWHAALDRRTCAACWASHGEEFPTDRKPSMHPCCRCGMVPRTRSWAELGIDLPDTRPTVEPGADVFEKLSGADKLTVLGPGKYELYRAGDLELSDLIKTTRSAYGEARVEKPLRELGVRA